MQTSIDWQESPAADPSMNLSVNLAMKSRPVFSPDREAIGSVGKFDGGSIDNNLSKQCLTPAVLEALNDSMI